MQHYTVLQYVPEPETLHRGVRRLESGCYARIRPGTAAPDTTRYFVPRFAATPITRDTEQARYDEITAVLEDSVAKHMRADVTVGAFSVGWHRLDGDRGAGHPAQPPADHLHHRVRA